MKRKSFSILTAALALVLMLTMLGGCGMAKEPEETAEPDGAAEPADSPETAVEAGSQDGEGELSDEQALDAIKRYCCIGNPDLESIVNAGEYQVYWEIVSSDANEIVVLFRSYTGVQLRYYVDRMTGNTYVTEFVPGVSSGEERTEESFNARDYLLSLAGTWQTASVGYELDGTMQPEYYVQFTDAEILYGHMKDGAFVVDHADKIASLEKTVAGGFIVRAESSNGVKYTYQTAESDPDVLEYYETWQEEEFSELYRGGASLSRCGE